MPVKVPKATKDLAYQKLRDGLSNKEVADLTGLSMRSIGRMKSLLSEKMAMPARSAPSVNDPQITPESTPHTGATLDFEESPAPVEKKSAVDSAMASLKGMLGIKDEKSAKSPPIVSAKLDAKKQAFVDAASPTLSLALMSLATWLWGKIGPEYSHLAPDEKVAQRIVEPLLRVYARHADFLTDINPDVADIGASLFALVGYVHVSLGLYQQIKQEKLDYEQGYSQDENISGIRRRAAATESEDRAGNASRGYAPIQRPSYGNIGANGGNARTANTVNQPNLTDKEARQHAALSRLSELDYLSRSRRSGKVA